MSHTSDTYRERAAECFEIAARAPSEKFKAQLLALARKLQAQALKAEALAETAEEARKIYA
jgi:hypothetical protein